MFKFDLSDFTSIGSQLTDVLAKAGADIEHAADNALGTKMPGGEATNTKKWQENTEASNPTPPMPMKLTEDAQTEKADEPVKKKVIKKVIKKVVKKELAAGAEVPSNDTPPIPSALTDPPAEASHSHHEEIPAALNPQLSLPILDPALNISSNESEPVKVDVEAPPDPPLSALLDQIISKENQAVLDFDKISQLQELVEQLQRKNEELAMRSSKISEQDLEEMRGEFEERVGVLDRKVYALTKERDALKKNSERINELTTIIQKKEEAIVHLTQEGEKLSSKQMDLEQHMKKVRQQCTAAEVERDKLKGKLEAESAELEVQRRLRARLEQDLTQAHEQTRSELEAQRMTYEGLLSKARSDYLEAEERAKEAANQCLHRKVKESESRAEALVEGVNELREALERQRQAADLREEMLKQDITDLERRCQAAELRHQDLTAKLPETTRPLLRQIEAMQAAATAQAETWAAAEEMLQARVEAAEEKTANAVEKERMANEKLSVVMSRVSTSDGAQNALRSEIQSLRDQLDTAREGQSLAEERCKAAVAKLVEAEKLAEASAQHSDQVAKAVTETLKMEQKAREAAERDADAISRDYERRINGLEQQLQQYISSSNGPDSHPPETPARAGPGYRWFLVKDGEVPDPHSSSSDVITTIPQPDQGRIDHSTAQRSIEDGFLFSNILGTDSGDPFASPSKSFASPFQRNTSSSHMSQAGGVGPMLAADAEALRAALRMKQTEFAALNEQVRELKLTRDQLAEELVKATQKSDQAAEALGAVSSLREEVEASQAKYIAAVELLGEKDEVLEELRADLEDVKNLYKDQIEYLVNAVVASTPVKSSSPSSPWS